MPESLKVFSIFPVPSKKMYEAWLDSKEHSAFTNSEAIIDPCVGGEFSAWEGYITGKQFHWNRSRGLLRVGEQQILMKMIPIHD